MARLQTINAQRILAQLTRCKLVRLRGWSVVLSGIEITKDATGQPREVAQSWVCELHILQNAVGHRIRLYASGVAVPKRATRDDSGSLGLLVVGDDYSNVLQRHTACAELRSHQISTFPAARLIDCHIEWMSEESFELGGLRVREPIRKCLGSLSGEGGWSISISCSTSSPRKRRACCVSHPCQSACAKKRIEHNSCIAGDCRLSIVDIEKSIALQYEAALRGI